MVDMTLLYKATRPDGTDFRTGTVLYQVGQRTTHPTSGRRERDNPATYLSVSTVPTDCTGMAWPCRLFTVTGVGRPMTARDLPNKRAFLAVDVTGELPAHETFGPQGERVAAIIARAGRLTLGESRALAAARAAAWDAARAAAGDAARAAAWDAAARAAAWAYLARDLITAGQFTTLAGPWHSVIGEPPVTIGDSK
jgi:hypothetical protein